MHLAPVDAVLSPVNANDQSYYLRRAFQEREAACAAACPEARERHEELAAAYRLRCRLGATPNAPQTSRTLSGVDCTA